MRREASKTGESAVGERRGHHRATSDGLWRREGRIADLANEVARICPPARGALAGEGHVRVPKSALQERLGRDLKGDHSVVSSPIESVAVLVNRHEVGRDSRTRYERSRGKTSKVLELEFVELLNFRRVWAPGRLGKCYPLRHGPFLGERLLER